MKIAIASCQDFPDWDTDDDIFHKLLSEHNIEFQVSAWDSKLDWSQFDLCLIRSTWDYQERFEQFIDWINQVSQQTVLLNNKNVVLWNSHKRYLMELEQQQISIAPSEWLLKGESADLKQLMANRQWKQGFIKPLIGANARECYRFDNSRQSLADAQQHIERLQHKEDLVLQPYLASVEKFGETSLVYFAGQFSHATRKVPVKGDFRVQDDYGAQDYLYQPSKQELQLANQALNYVTNKYGELLYARIDFLHSDDGSPYLNEMELIEPSLFFRHGGAQAAEKLVIAIEKWKQAN